jgi:beta-RFAP synthase
MRDLGIDTLARMAGRGGRSGIGMHGFVRGGLIVDGGHGRAGAVAPLLARHAFPKEWRVVLTRPVGHDGAWSGNRERAAFARARPPQVTVPLTDRMARLLVLGVLPALVERDCDSFGEALHEYNRLAGRMFAEDQGGDYGSPEVEAAVNAVRDLGVAGAGQSSWGPTVFAVVEDWERAVWLERELKDRHPQFETTISTGNDGGAALSD